MMDTPLVFILLLIILVAVLGYLTFDLVTHIIPAVIEWLSFVFTGKSGGLGFLHYGSGLNASDERFLAEKIPYYRQLNDVQKRVFGIRVRNFIKGKNFAGRKELQVTWEMKLLIAATAVKVTFGYRKYLLSHFRQIIVYPSAYFSNATQSTNKGETHASGVIVFSWPDFVKGYELESDALNLGYHEFAHALYLDERGFNRNSCFKKYYPEWERILRDGTTVKKIRDEGIFRSYATANEAEFFAVALENFFENAQQFNSQLPELFGIMCGLLNQNPFKDNK